MSTFVCVWFPTFLELFCCGHHRFKRNSFPFTNLSLNPTEIASLIASLLTQLNSLTLQTIWNTVGFRTKFCRVWFDFGFLNVFRCVKLYMCVCVICVWSIDSVLERLCFLFRLTSRFTSVSSAKIWYKICCLFLRFAVLSDFRLYINTKQFC